MKKYKPWHIGMACVFTFIIAFIVTESLKRVDILEPITDSVLDWDFTDFAYANYQPETTKKDTNIVIVNIGQLDRAGIAQLIKKIKRYEPKVLGVDVIFSGRRSNFGDSLLKDTFENSDKLVLVKSLNSSTSPYLINDQIIFGFSEINFEKGGVIRSIDSQKKIDDNIYLPFDAEIVKHFDPEAFDNFVKRENEIEIIHYTGRNERFTVLNHNSDEFELLKNRIVLLGFVGEGNENLFFTPLKKQTLGKTIPDSHGVIIHGNIISMILNGDYINQNTLINSLINTCLFILFTLLFFFLFDKYPNDFGLIARVVSLLLIMFLIILCVQLYREFNYKYSISMAVLFLLFAPDCCEFFFKKISNQVNRLTKKIQLRFIIVFFTLIALGLLANLYAAGNISIYSFAFKVYISCFIIYFITLTTLVYRTKL